MRENAVDLPLTGNFLVGGVLWAGERLLRCQRSNLVVYLRPEQYRDVSVEEIRLRNVGGRKEHQGPDRPMDADRLLSECGLVV